MAISPDEHAALLHIEHLVRDGKGADVLNKAVKELNDIRKRVPTPDKVVDLAEDLASTVLERKGSQCVIDDKAAKFKQALFQYRTEVERHAAKNG